MYNELRDNIGYMQKIMLFFALLQVTDVYGFNIAFEFSQQLNAKEACNLDKCNFNGECLATRNATNPGAM